MAHSQPDPQPQLSSPSPAALVNSPCSSPVVLVAPAGRQTVWWVMIVLLAVLVTAVLSRQDRTLLPSAMAQSAMANQAAGARGIYAFTGQLTAKSYGLFMMDVDSGTVWCYELQHGPNGEPQMKLVAARSWLYDRFLEEFNVADPVPSAVKALVQQMRNGPAAGAATVNSPAAQAPAVPAPGPAASGGGVVLPRPAGSQ